MEKKGKIYASKLIFYRFHLIDVDIPDLYSGFFVECPGFKDFP